MEKFVCVEWGAIPQALREAIREEVDLVGITTLNPSPLHLEEAEEDGRSATLPLAVRGEGRKVAILRDFSEVGNDLHIQVLYEVVTEET